MDLEGVWHNNAYKPTQPGECVSEDQLKSPTLGITARLIRRLTTKFNNIATIFFIKQQYSAILISKKLTASRKLSNLSMHLN